MIAGHRALFYVVERYNVSYKDATDFSNNVILKKVEEIEEE